MAWGGKLIDLTSMYRFLSSSFTTELKLDLSRVDQIISANNGKLTLNFTPNSADGKLTCTFTRAYKYTIDCTSL